MLEWLTQLFMKRRPTSGLRTVRFAFPLFLVTAIVASLASVVTQDTSYIAISTNPATVSEGQLFYIEVKAYAHVPVNAVDIVLNYPADKVVIEGIDTGTSIITLWAEEPYAKDGKVYLRGGVFQRGFVGEHTIARVRAHATAAGVAHVSTDAASFVAGDGQGTEVVVNDAGMNETRMYITAANDELAGEATVSIISDVNGDGTVDLADISAFMAAWFTRSKTFDFNNDGRMTFSDFSILLADSFFK